MVSKKRKWKRLEDCVLQVEKDLR